jgi:hypothetical protein
MHSVPTATMTTTATTKGKVMYFIVKGRYSSQKLHF